MGPVMSMIALKPLAKPPITRTKSRRLGLRVLALMGAVAVAACSPEPTPDWSGYVHAQYVYVSAPLPGRLRHVLVQPGQSVSAGQPLFELDSDVDQLARQEAVARYQAAQAQAQNLNTGRREQEIAPMREQLVQAQAQADLAQKAVSRQQALVRQGFVAQALLDDAQSDLVRAQARVRELQAWLQAAELPARQQERMAAQAQARVAQESIKQTDWRRAQKRPVATQAGLVSEVFFQPGEQVAAMQPVLSILPPDQLRARFYVPESVLPSIRLGASVQLGCSACGGWVAAQISRIASSPEYTPPVIYSNAQRQHLVYMVEARPSVADAARLRPGQPLDVRPAAMP